jgi:mono/diheme cytochrome c family protein
MKAHPVAFTTSAATLAILAALGLTLAPPASAAEPAAKPADAGAAAKLARGQYLVNTSGCHDCHTPFKLGANGPEPDMSRMLSGHPEQLVMPAPPQLPPGPWLMVSAATNTAHAGPWGVSFTANLTPEAETGLGRWTAKDFVATIRTGRHMGRGRVVLPPMPVPVYNNFVDEDLEAIFAYLRTIPAVKNRVPEPIAPAATTAQK